MLLPILDAGRKVLGAKGGDIPLPVETPNMGLLHPDYLGVVRENIA